MTHTDMSHDTHRHESCRTDLIIVHVIVDTHSSVPGGRDEALVHVNIQQARDLQHIRGT